MLTTPKAILIGFSLIAAALLFQPLIGVLAIPPAQAQLKFTDFEMFDRGLTRIATSIQGIQACKN
jgi:hypothetical protein